MSIRGFLLLAGGAEFGGGMAQADLRAIQLAGGVGAPVRIIPAAAAPDNNHPRAGQNGVRWFKQLGAVDVASLPLIDRASADEPALARELESARLIYLLGGFPGHLYQSLAGSRSWQAILTAHQAGAVIAGSSAGAMVLCQHFFDPYAGGVRQGLNVVPNACVLPHYNRSGRRWAAQLGPQLPGVTLVGIDEATAMIDDGLDGRWSMYGPGGVTLHQEGATRVYPPGETFIFPA